MVFVCNNLYSEDKVKKFLKLRGKVDTIHVHDLSTDAAVAVLKKYYPGLYHFAQLSTGVVLITIFSPFQHRSIRG